MQEIRINVAKNEVVMTKKFSDRASDPRSNEFRILQEVMQTYPNIKVRRHTIKKNPNKECYRGLTYEYMRHYIVGHETKETVMAVLEEFNEMILVSKCHSKGLRYPTIKAWFLKKYSEVEKFGMQQEESDELETFEEVSVATPECVTEENETIEEQDEEVLQPAA